MRLETLNEGDTLLKPSFRMAPPSDMPAFARWFDCDLGYLRSMQSCASLHGHGVERMLLVDSGLCRMTLMARDGGMWKAYGGYDAVCGLTGHPNSMGVIARLSPVASPEDLPLIRRHVADAGVGCRAEVVRWLGDVRQQGMPVLVFDGFPGKCRSGAVVTCDGRGEGGSPVIRYESLPLPSKWMGIGTDQPYDREGPSGMSRDPLSGKSGHVSHSDLERVSATQGEVLSATKRTPEAGSGMCLAWVNDVFDNAGHGFERLWAASEAWREWCLSSDVTDLRPGMIVAVESTETSPVAGHIGIYVGDGEVMDNETYGGEGVVKTRPLGEWIEMFGTVSEPRWGWAGGTPLDA